MTKIRIRMLSVFFAAVIVAPAAGCAVVGVAATATSLAVGAVSTAGDVVIGAGKLTAKAVGAGIDALTPGPTTPPAAPAPAR